MARGRRQREGHAESLPELMLDIESVDLEGQGGGSDRWKGDFC